MGSSIALGRRRLIHAATIAVLAWAGTGQQAMGQSAADYPSHPIRLIVPFPAGGYSDLLSRVIGKEMGQSFKQSVVVENRSGAGGNIGTEIVAKSAPDGYTLVMGTIGTHAINGFLFKDLSFDPVKDFVPVAFAAEAEGVLVVNPSIPVKTAQDIVALSKSKPEGLTYASGGTGTTSHLAGELFKSLTGANLVHVPYKGNSPALTDVMTGQVALSFATLAPALPFIQSGKLKPIAVLGKSRSVTLPDVPTLAESGLPTFEVNNWTGLFAPAGTPAAIVDKLNKEVDRIMRTPDVQTLMKNQGLRYTFMTPAQYGAFDQAEIVKWGKVIKAAGVHVE